MFKIMSIPNTDRFFQVVEASCGNVFLQLPDNTRCDLKRDHTARQLLRAMHPGQEGLCIRLTNPSDLSGFVRYMMEASYD